MIKAMDVLLRQWGQERAVPVFEASVRSPLGDTDQWMGGGRSTGGSAGLGLVAMTTQHSRVCLLVDEALRSLSSTRDAGGLGGRGAVLYTLAKVRYVHAGEMPPVAAQLVELKISERTYRAQVDELHGWLLPRLESHLRAEALSMQKRRVRGEAQVEDASAVRHGLSERKRTLSMLAERKRTLSMLAAMMTVRRVSGVTEE